MELWGLLNINGVLCLAGWFLSPLTVLIPSPSLSISYISIVAITCMVHVCCQIGYRNFVIWWTLSILKLCQSSNWRHGMTQQAICQTCSPNVHSLPISLRSHHNFCGLLERIWKEMVIVYSRKYPGGTEKNYETSVRIVIVLADINQGPPECKSSVTSRPDCSVPHDTNRNGVFF